MLGRLLVPDWVSRRPKTTFLELGSFFNQHFGDVQLQAYQRKVLTPGCSTQRDRRLDDTAFSGMRRCLEGMGFERGEHKGALPYQGLNSPSPNFACKPASLSVASCAFLSFRSMDGDLWTARRRFPGETAPGGKNGAWPSVDRTKTAPPGRP